MHTIQQQVRKTLAKLLPGMSHGAVDATISKLEHHYSLKSKTPKMKIKTTV